MESKKHMKRILILLLSVISIASFAQSGSAQYSGVFTRVNDTTAYQSAAVAKHSAGYADQYWNNQATTPHMDIWNGSSYDHVFDFGGGTGSSAYTGNSPTTVTVGGLSSGTNISAYSTSDVLEAIVAPYVNPTWNSFSSSQSTPVEVGTTLSGSKTFTWSLNANSGVVSTIDIYDVTASSTLLAGTANDGTQAQSITSIQLNSSGATQVWRGVANNSSPSGTVNSSNYTVTGYFYRFYGPTATSPTNSATVRGLPSSAFDTGSTSFTLATGTTEINFMVCLPPGRAISSVIDQSALNADITSSYVLQSSINVLDAGSTNRAYVIYKCTIAVPYGTSHNHYITY